MYQKLTVDKTGTFKGEIVTGRHDGESHEDYRARRHQFNETLYGKVVERLTKRGVEKVRTKGYKGGQLFWDSSRKGTYVKPKGTPIQDIKMAA